MAHRGIDSLDKRLGNLQVNKELPAPGTTKKIPPAVPPKKKTLQSFCEAPELAIPPAGLGRDPGYAESLQRRRIPMHDYNLVSSSGELPTRNNLQGNLNMDKFATYTNIPSFNNNLVPSLPPLGATTKKFDVNLNSKVEEMMPPPSPVSSNYSELARATLNMNTCQNTHCAPFYQNEYQEFNRSQNSTNESLYEPIEPHVPNKCTTNDYHNYKTDSPVASKLLPKEAEVDTLTDLLIQSISDNQDPDYFGICFKCNGKVVGEHSGCTALGNLYHVKCFTCHQCNINLHGKRLYAIEGQPYCEVDYLETLEKCSVCNKPIVDRILRATGNPYHRECFTCVACGKSLDGIPFTVDAMNRIHCIEDFHKKFAPRCCVCELPIMPEEGQEETVRVVALDRSFHVRCYRCEDCGFLLSSEAEGRGCYPLDDHILCKNCNAQRIRSLTNVMTTDL